MGFGALVLAVVLGGCQATAGGTDGRAGPVSGAASGSAQPVVLDDLGRSAGRVADALDTLRRIEQSRTAPAPDPIDETMVPPELQRRATFTWHGPVESVLREVASQVGYRFAPVGARPEIDPMVEVHARDEPLVRVLQEIGLQARKWGTIVVDPNTLTIELRYDRQAAERSIPASGGPRPLVGGR